MWNCEQVVNGSAVLPCTFNFRLLAIHVTASNQRPSWYKAGYLVPFIVIDGINFYSKPIKLKFGGQLIELPLLNCQLRFDPAEWLNTPTIQIKELDLQNYLN